ncbi:MAG: UDP-glucose 6-dehydrogenase [Candidatus Wallbacteria bacterium HGW-Wallbacteria-1]|jgi:UDPglucose 6-dehydrogenase|uniref:UDP-glucose 6-dehydrogenase n=1 Tax=Candidatus Wallbacteria bacterium HGW-Wallbacteria-1 TaxID=2013854 RepID=A0A2N1PP31_9BACT|nr:MAG: UDP-glucose 6-dehydrogenase [Candidatus Wallbacteria bacterium HGW-Wallbacteria-1]
MKICVIGSGYVGLVVGACFAETGNDVVCVDKDSEKISMLENGKIPIYEPGLDTLVLTNVKEGRLKFSQDIDASIKRSLVNFIAVGTPSDEDGSADLSHVLAVAESIGKAMDGYKIIVDKSTVPVGTADKVRACVSSFTEHEFDVVSNPEFLKEGSAIDDFLKPERVVIGTDNVRVAEIMKELYSPFVRTGNPIIIMDIKSAEITKYAANAMLATRISFMNEFAKLCEKVGANISDVRRGIASDSRIGRQFLFPGVGYGGSCFPKDVKAIIRTSRTFDLPMEILESVESVNEKQKHHLANKVIERFGSDLTGLTFSVWGLAFKPKTDDMREAPAIVIINDLLEHGAKVKAFDPIAMEETRRRVGDKIEYSSNNYACLKDSDALLVVTEWNEFRHPDFERMESLMKNKIIFDGRNIYGRELMHRKGFEYYSIGNA